MGGGLPRYEPINISVVFYITWRNKNESASFCEKYLPFCEFSGYEVVFGLRFINNLLKNNLTVKKSSPSIRAGLSPCKIN